MLVSDCLKSLLDPEDENLTKTSEVNHLIRQCRKHLTSNIIAQAESIAVFSLLFFFLINISTLILGFFLVIYLQQL
jgi:hypothetical protein